RALEEKEPERVMSIEWVPQKDRSYPVALRFETLDRPGVLADISTIVSSANINIDDVRVRRTNNLTVLVDMVIQVRSAQELRAIISKLNSLENVLSISRVAEGKGRDASRAAAS
ncbi:MAG: ACT domain-containing protein, partial [Fimbriimonadales bacterium]